MVRYLLSSLVSASFLFFQHNFLSQSYSGSHSRLYFLYHVLFFVVVKINKIKCLKAKTLSNLTMIRLSVWKLDFQNDCLKYLKLTQRFHWLWWFRKAGKRVDWQQRTIFIFADNNIIYSHVPHVSCTHHALKHDLV